MKHSIQHFKTSRWQPCHTEGVAVTEVEDEGVVRLEELNEEVARDKVKIKVAKSTPDTRVQGTLTSLLLAPVGATGFSEKELIFVRNQDLAPGRTSTLPKPINEIQTSSAKHRVSMIFTTCYIQT